MSSSRPPLARPDADSLLATATALLAELIAHPTHAPGGDELALCERLAADLGARGADDVEIVEVPRPGGAPGGYVYARYGTPRFLINVHLDTVPVNSGWTRDPFRAEITPDRIYGLGSADTKGAIAAVLTALSAVRPRNLGVLFSGDEEQSARCVQAFVASERVRGLERALVCEPTARAAGVRHRGVSAYSARLRGKGGHSSRADHMPKPIVTMARLAVSLDELGRRYLDQGPEDMRGVCMNVAALAGGVAFNVVPEEASLTWSVRPPPGFDAGRFGAELAACAAAVDPAITWTTDLDAQPFACRDAAWYQALLGAHARAFVPLDFWTEAALLSARGVDAVVIGPGDIAQAHGADEFVTLDDLRWAIALFLYVLARHDTIAADNPT